MPRPELVLDERFALLARTVEQLLDGDRLRPSRGRCRRSSRAAPLTEAIEDSPAARAIASTMRPAPPPTVDLSPIEEELRRLAEVIQARPAMEPSVGVDLAPIQEELRDLTAAIEARRCWSRPSNCRRSTPTYERSPR